LSQFLPYAFCLVVFLSGMIMMFRVWHIWDDESEKARTAEDRKFSSRKFRRRTLIGSMIAIVGALLASVLYAEDPRVRATLTLALLLILFAILIYAFVDLLSVYVHVNHGKSAGDAKKKLALEYKRMREDIEDQISKKTKEKNQESDTLDNRSL